MLPLPRSYLLKDAFQTRLFALIIRALRALCRSPRRLVLLALSEGAVSPQYLNIDTDGPRDNEDDMQNRFSAWCMVAIEVISRLSGTRSALW